MAESRTRAARSPAARATPPTEAIPSPPSADDDPPVRASDGVLDAVASDEPLARPCPHCGGPLVKHDSPPDSPKHGAWHCDACGGCWVHRGSAWFLRDGHPAPAGWDAS
jgi:hypothetical protein